MHFKKKLTSDHSFRTRTNNRASGGKMRREGEEETKEVSYLI